MALVTAAMASVLVIAPMTSASAEQTTLTLDPDTETTITYGEQWYFQFDAPVSNFDPSVPITMEISGPESGTFTEFARYYNPQSRSLFGTVGSGLFDGRFVAPGSYDVGVTLRSNFFGQEWVSTVAQPTRLIVNPGEMRVEHKIVADPINPANAIVSAQLTGAFIDEWGFTLSLDIPEEFRYPKIPGGTWSVQVKDGEEIVLDRQIEQPTDSFSSFAFYWNDIPLNRDLSSTVTFTPESSAAGNFEVTQAPAFAFTSAVEGRPVPVADATGSDEIEVAAVDGVSFPLWTLLIASVFALVLVVAIALLAVRARRSPTAPSVIGSETPPAEGDVPPSIEAPSSEQAAEPAELNR